MRLSDVILTVWAGADAAGRDDVMRELAIARHWIYTEMLCGDPELLQCLQRIESFTASLAMGDRRFQFVAPSSRTTVGTDAPRIACDVAQLFMILANRGYERGQRHDEDMPARPGTAFHAGVDERSSLAASMRLAWTISPLSIPLGVDPFTVACPLCKADVGERCQQYE